MDDKLYGELIETGKKQSGMLRIMVITNVILTVGILFAFVLVIPKLLSVVNDVQQAVTEVQELSSSAQDSLSGADQIISGANDILNDADQMVIYADQLLKDNSTSMEEALNNFNSVDFEALNNAINDLADAVKPLASLSRLLD